VKTQIIALDPLEDHLSVRDKMNWSQTGRVLLTWPNDKRILTRLDLVLVQRFSAGRGVQLGLVTRNEDIRAEAAELGIPAFDTPREAQVARWRTTRRRRIPRRVRKTSAELQALRQAAQPAKLAWINHPAVRVAAFMLGLLAILAVLVYILPTAQVWLSPQNQEQSLTLEASASPETATLNPAGRLPTYPVSVIVEARDSLPASGTVLVPYKPAMGGIQFTNLTEEPVEVPAGAIVSTLESASESGPVRFATTKAGQVPAGIGESLVLPAAALMPGSIGNLPAGSLVAIEGPLGLQLSATNLSATHSGSDSLTNGPSESDRAALLEQMTASLRQSAAEEMQANLPPGDQALPITLRYLRTLEEAYSTEPGQPADQLELTLRLEFEGQAVSGADLETFATPFLDAALPEGYAALPGTFENSSASPPVMNEQGEISWKMHARRQLQAEIPAAEVIALLSGKSISEASQALRQALPLANAPTIRVTPAWWPRLPLAAFRIQVSPEELP
jgi:hypothetical protein